MTASKQVRSGGPAMADVAAWTDEIKKDHELFVRFTWRRGLGPRDWQLSAQAYSVQDGRPLVRATVDLVWPTRACKTPEALMLNALIQLEHILDRPLIGASADGLLPPSA